MSVRALTQILTTASRLQHALFGPPDYSGYRALYLGPQHRSLIEPCEPDRGTGAAGILTDASVNPTAALRVLQHVLANAMSLVPGDTSDPGYAVSLVHGDTSDPG